MSRQNWFQAIVGVQIVMFLAAGTSIAVVLPVTGWTIQEQPVFGGPGNPAGPLTVLKEGDTYRAWHDEYAASGERVMYIESPTPDGLWPQPSIPVFSPQNANDAMPEVVKRGASYNMWVGQRGQDGQGAAYATSPDGYSWTQQGIVSEWYFYSVLPTDSGFEAWYKRYDDQTRFYHATSSDGINWQGEQSTLTAGAFGEFDAYIGALDIVELNDTYHMWYVANNGSSDPARFAYATSDDGITWQKHGLLHGDFDNIDEDDDVVSPSVIVEGDTVRLWYHLSAATSPEDQYNYYASVPEPSVGWLLAFGMLPAIIRTRPAKRTLR